MAIVQPPSQVFDDLHYREEGLEVPADTQRIFMWQGEEIKLDLTEEHAVELDDFFRRYVKVGTKVERTGPKRARKSSRAPHTPERQRSAEIREWAESQGIDISPRGRIKTETREAFYQAHPHLSRPIED
jgi:hypothetical protein